MNGAVCGFGGISPNSYKASAFQPDAVIFWQALETNPGDFNDGSSSPDEGITRIHNIGTTVGVIDGHVDYIKIRDFNREATRKPGRLWNVPDSKTGQ